MPKHTTTDPNRVADLVKGGGLKPDTLKKPKPSACWRLWHGLHPLSPIQLGNFGGFILPVSLHKLPGGLSFMDLGSSARNKFSNSRVDF